MDQPNESSSGRGLRHARQMLACGQVPPAGLVRATVARSWQRSMDAGLTPFRRTLEAPHLSGAELRPVIDRHRALLDRARPVMDYLHAQLRGSGSMILLADDQGVVLETLGDADFLGRAQRVALMPGASWREGHRGTNAIGTALAEAAPVVVHGGEHFLDHNAFLTCAAAPVVGPDGRLVGVIDISGHQRDRHPHTAGLAGACAHMIENRLFEAAFAGALRLRLHPRADGIGTIAEGLVALDGDGRVIGANRAAQALLAMGAGDFGRVRLDGRLPLTTAQLFDWARHSDASARLVATGTGLNLFVRAEAPAGRSRPAAAGPGAGPAAAGPNAASVPLPPRDDALAALDLGDAAMAQAIARARKVAGKPVALLLQGESGVGKDVFALAVHASGPRRAGPFVAVNCAALPDHLVEAELFGYAPGAFTGARRDGAKGRIREAEGGTLLLDEIGDMPLALQTRLLRVLQDRQVTPLGGGAAHPVDFVLIAATHRPLRQAVEQGRFRADLYYRLNGLVLTLPPLRDRTDRAALIAAILERAEPGAGLSLAGDVAAAFASHDWPGNIRQMANALVTACALRDPGETVLSWHHLPDDLVDDLRGGSDAAVAVSGLRAVADAAIDVTMAAVGGNLSEAARRLGVSRNTLYRRLRRK